MKGMKVLVTGGTGSFGHRFVDIFKTRYPDNKIIVYSRDEFKQHEMQKLYPNGGVEFMIGDIRDKERINEAMEGIDFVFHAAALKHVPNCERDPMEAVKTNILGGTNVMEAALKNQVQNLVVLSTDKAAYPINMMGMSKAVMEKQMQAYARRARHTIYSGVRYGNVMCSRGSVIPHFINLIQNHLPINITDPTMTRFLLSLTDAINLVLFAFNSARPGDMYIRKAPAATILTVAKALYKILGREESITITGIRPGEKKHETLVTAEEMANARDLGDYFCIPDFNYSYRDYYDGTEKSNLPAESYTSQSEELNVEQTAELLMTLSEVRDALYQQ